MSIHSYGNMQALNSVKPVVSTTKGTDIMDAMMLSQYSGSVNLRTYMLAFVEEMDYLFEQTEEVYLGRMLEFAVGRQQDVLGIILDQPRTVSISKGYFGFVGAGLPGKMADEASPAIGGYFKGEGEENYAVTPLDDDTYRRLLLAKAYANTLSNASIEETYQMVIQLLGHVPRKIQLLTSASILGTVAARTVELQLSSEDTSISDAALIDYFSKFMVPLGTTFLINRS